MGVQIEEARQRWKGFLSKIEERFNEITSQAEEGCLQMLDLANLDYLPMNNAWIAVNAQLRGLIDKIDKTWNEKVSETFEDAYYEENPNGDHDKEYAAAETFADELDRRKEQVEARIYDKAARKLIDAAKESLSGEFKCTQCKAELTLEEDIFHSYYVTCQYCSTVNTFEPGTKVRNVEAVCADWIAKAEAFDEETNMLKLMDEVQGWGAAADDDDDDDDDDNDDDNDSDDDSDAPYEKLKELEEASRIYWTKFYEKRAEIVPSFEASLDKDIAARMETVYVDLQGEANWHSDDQDPKFNVENIRAHLLRVGKGLVEGGAYPEEVYDHFVADNDGPINEWLASIWKEEIEKEVEAVYKDNLGLFLKIMPMPSSIFDEGFLNQMEVRYSGTER